MTGGVLKKHKPFIDLAWKTYNKQVITRKEICDLFGTPARGSRKGLVVEGAVFPHWIMNDPQYRIGRGLYKLPSLNGASMNGSTPSVSAESEDSGMEASDEDASAPATRSIPMDTGHDYVSNTGTVATIIKGENEMTTMNMATSTASLVPKSEPTYVAFGDYKEVKSIIRSKKFYPVFISGLSGNGKTLMIHQICSDLRRDLCRVNITIETDEDDLLGGFRLVDGQTVWHNGPVIEAMERGAVLLLDEVDLASHKVMCLQPIMEGKGVFLKKINRFVKPAKGFTVIATANTKGKGSDDGRFIGTNVLNEAFLERFPITIEQKYPNAKIEKKILMKVLELEQMNDEEFVDKLVRWAEVIRKTFDEGGVDEVISTRRLVHIAQAYGIFGGDKMKAINMCVNRFDTDTKLSFLDLYTKVDSGVDMSDSGDEAVIESTSDVQEKIDAVLKEAKNQTNKIEQLLEKETVSV